MKAQLTLLILSIKSELLTLSSICLAFFLPVSGILFLIGLFLLYVITSIKLIMDLESENFSNNKLIIEKN
jgi:hypothetical protein